jgi:hypothetical protein
LRRLVRGGTFLQFPHPAHQYVVTIRDEPSPDHYGWAFTALVQQRVMAYLARLPHGSR